MFNGFVRRERPGMPHSPSFERRRRISRLHFPQGKVRKGETEPRSSSSWVSKGRENPVQPGEQGSQQSSCGRKMGNASLSPPLEARNRDKASFPRRKKAVIGLREARKGDKEGMVRGRGSSEGHPVVVLPMDAYPTSPDAWLALFQELE